MRLNNRKALPTLVMSLALSCLVVGQAPIVAAAPLPVSQAVELAVQQNMALKLASLSYQSAKITHDKALASNPTDFARLSADITWDKAQQTYKQAKSDVVIGALSTYLNLQGILADIEIKDKQATSAQRTLDRTKIYVQKGTASSLDELQAQLGAVSAANAADRADESYAESLSAYAHTLGLEKLPEIATSDFLLIPELKMSQEEALQTVLASNITIKEKEVALKLAQIQRAQDQLLELAPVDEQLSKNNLTLAELSLAKARYDLEESVTTAYNSLSQSKKSLSVAQSAYDLEVKRFDIVRKQFDAGLKTPSDLETAEITLLKSESDLFAAQRGYVLAYLSFQKTLGNEIDLSGVVKPDASK